MTNREVFETYLESRYQKEGALTPGMKLEVIDKLENEARQQGLVPTGMGSVSRVPVDNPAVQAVLRGEDVSLGGVSVQSKSNAGGMAGFLERLPEQPMHIKIGILVGIFLAIVLLAFLIMGGGRAEEVELTPTASPEPTLTATLPPPTAIPPTPLPPPTATPVILLGAGGPAESSRDPASIEIAERLFIVSNGIVNDDGSWTPQGSEWLQGTEIRRVFSVPYEQLQDAIVNQGDLIFVRTRGGNVLTYVVRDVVTLQANQIESFFSLRPSLVVALPKASGDVNQVERVVIFGEAQIEEVAVMESVQQQSTGPSSISGAANAYTMGGVNLRDNPGLESNILIGLPDRTPLVVDSKTPPVSVDEVTWVYVLSPYGYGWVAKQMIAMP